MMPTRLLRIAVVAVALPLLFQFSERISTARGGESVPGRLWAIGALAVLFLLRALATEYGRGPEANLQKDLQWGLALGGMLTIASQWWVNG